MKQNNSNLVGASTDFCAGCVQLWMRSAEPPGQHRYENWKTTTTIWLGDGRMHHAPFCWHGYVPLRCGVRGCRGGRRYEKRNKTTAIWLGQVRTSVPGVCNYGYVPLNHLGNIVMRFETTTSGCVEFEICRIVSINCNYITKDRQANTQR